MIDKISKKQCTGCKMCADICPKTAITFDEDNQGFWYPKINSEKCIECNLCEKKCPALNPLQKTNENDPIVYAAWSKNDDVRISSTSGGAFWVIAKRFLDNGGVVAGCKYKDDWKSAEHILAYTVEELEQIKGSKYFQSDTENIYKKVQAALKNGKKVLFCGTPCQNVALYAFLGREYENLYCMDFICRNINSPKAFRAYIEELEQEYGSKVKQVHLKNKKFGWRSLASQVVFENGKESIRDRNNDWWVKGFIKHDLYTRESCCNCQYKVLPRVSADITIGDFWGIKNQTEEDLFKGISVLLVNNEKGKALLEMAQDDLFLQHHTLEEALEGNPALLKNPSSSKKQAKFFKMLEKAPFSTCVRECTKNSVIDQVKAKSKTILRKTRKGLSVVKNGKISIPKYIYYNYFSKNVVRKGNAKIIPYKGSILDLHPTARIYLDGRNLEVNTNKLKGSKAETHIRMNKNAIWNCNNGGYLFYNTVLEIKENAVFDSKYFSANGGSVIIAHKHITFGEDVMIGRNVIVYDSDFHTIKNDAGVPCNPPKPLVIQDHVWLTTNVMVQKGITLGKDSLVTAYTVVNKDMPEHSIIGGKSVGNVIKDQISWSRDVCPMQ